MSATVTQFVSGLKSRYYQNKTTQDLFLYVKTELREMPTEEQILFFDEFNHHIYEMVSSPDACEKKGGVLAISTYICCTCRFFVVYLSYRVLQSVLSVAMWLIRQHEFQGISIIFARCCRRPTSK